MEDDVFSNYKPVGNKKETNNKCIKSSRELKKKVLHQMMM